MLCWLRAFALLTLGATLSVPIASAASVTPIPSADANGSTMEMVRDYAPRVVLHPLERIGLANVGHFLRNTRLVFTSASGKKSSFPVDENTILTPRVTSVGVVHKPTEQLSDGSSWSFEPTLPCDWSSTSADCDRFYLRAANPVTAYSGGVVPEVYFRVTERNIGGTAYAVIQYFFFMMLNDAQNKHDGEWESSVVVVNKALYNAARFMPSAAAVIARRGAVREILMAGHYRHTPYDAATLKANESAVFVDGTSHFNHVMSRGGHGGYLLVPPKGTHEASHGCLEYIATSKLHYDAWVAPARGKRGLRLVEIGEQTPFVQYAGRWGQRYGVVPQVSSPEVRLSSEPVAKCEGGFFNEAVASRVTAVMSAPFGPKFIHTTVWNWTNFPEAPLETPKNLR